jgi:membrane associated rhomboid family serine protease
MIIPYLRGLLSPLKTPLTYFLFLLNVLVFAATWQSSDLSQSELDSIFENKEFLQTQGLVFAQLIAHQPQKFSPLLRQLSVTAQKGDRSTVSLMGNLALRNNIFMDEASHAPFLGDQVAFEKWQLDFKKLNEIQNENPSYSWGLSRHNTAWPVWFLYQFAHSGFAHLFWNMVFLLIFGVFAESLSGGLCTLICYLGAGLAGAASFALLTGISSSPLVGASAAVSGLMGFVVVFCWRQRVKFLFWLLPVQGYFGFVMLPVWVLFLVYLLPDLSGYLSSVSDFQSVAYGAHLGGTLFGALMAFAYKCVFKSPQGQERTLGEAYSLSPLEAP